MSLNKPDISPLTLEQLERAMPQARKQMATEEIVDNINNIIADPVDAEIYKENILSYTRVLQEGKFKMQDYLNAVMYCSHKMLGDTNMEAYVKVFPARYQHFLTTSSCNRQLNGHVSVYNARLLVQKILTQAAIPHYMLNRPMFQKALNAQADLMMYAKSEKVRSDAANSILTHLKPPEVSKLEVSVDIKEDAGVVELREMLKQHAMNQQLEIRAGVSTPKEIAHSRIIEVEIVEEE